MSCLVLTDRLQVDESPLCGFLEVLDLARDGAQDLEQLHVLLGGAEGAEVLQGGGRGLGVVGPGARGRRSRCGRHFGKVHAVARIVNTVGFYCQYIPIG